MRPADTIVHSTAADALQHGRCNVYALDVHAATGMRLHSAYTPCGFLNNQFAPDEWLHGLLKQRKTKRRWRHPWLVSNPATADVVVLSGHGFSRWCVVSTILRNRHAEEHTTWQKDETQRELCSNETVEVCGPPHSPLCKAQGRLFRSEVAKRKLWVEMFAKADALNTSAPRAVVYMNNECPHASAGAPKRPAGSTLMLVDYVRQAHDTVVPFVLSRPAWLLGDAPIPAELAPSRFPWAQRKLLLYAGHVPKLYISKTRYQLWRAWRRETTRVSIHTKDIACSLSAYGICRSPSRWEAEHDTFCQQHCGTARSCKPNAGSLQHECKSYAHVEWDEELPDVARTNHQLSRADYLQAAMSHRFCVVAPGDFPSTPKITEFVAIGAAGGCLPLIFVPSPVRDGAQRQLPYASTWLDYCAFGFIAPETAAQNASEMRLVLDRLEQVSEADAEKRRAALLRVRDAFVQRRLPPDGSAPTKPSAADFLLHEACAAARRTATKGGAPRRQADSRDPLERCLIAAEPAGSGSRRSARAARRGLVG